ncbi:MAG: xylose isomerase [Planctomycetota bacterium]|nr:xylose isomerase [Planctomycetota bacterium]
MTAFPQVDRVRFEGRDSDNPLAFRRYDPDRMILGRPMRDHLRFASCYWHTMRNGLADPFGVGTARMPWDDGSESIENALARVDVFFEFLEKIDIDFFCFHDRDIAPEGSTIAESEASLDKVVERIEACMQRTGRRLLWGTACLFTHPRYASGAATSPRVEAFCHAAAQVKAALEATHRLGGEGYVFWGGREGYGSLINTDLKRERAQLARLLHAAVEHKHRIGFEGQFYIEPKPKEPTTHQYDSDVAACLGFLREFDLLDHFKLNIETNHAWLAGHTMEHELESAIEADALGSIDANMGEWTNGWDTDHFPTDPMLCARIMRCVLKMGGFTTGGLNFDAKRRRESFEPIDLFHAHIAGMDAMAHGLEIAAAIQEDGGLDAFVRDRYASWDGELGRRIMEGGCSLEDLRDEADRLGEVPLESGRQEMLENHFNRFL